MRPSCRRRLRRRTLGVGASSPCSRIRRSTRLRLVPTPRNLSRAVSFLWPSPTNGDSAISRRIPCSSSRSGSAPTGPGRRRWMGAVGSETLRRRRCSHAADLDTPATRQTRPAARPAVLRRSAPRQPRAPTHLLDQAAQDVVVERELADLALRVSELALLHRPRPTLQPLLARLKKRPTPPADRAGPLAGLTRERIQRLPPQQPQDHLLLAPRAPAHLPAALR